MLAGAGLWDDAQAAISNPTTIVVATFKREMRIPASPFGIQLRGLASTSCYEDSTGASANVSAAHDRSFQRRVRQATHTGLHHDHRDQVSAHLGKAPQADETFELASHVRPPMPLAQGIRVLSAQ